MFERFSQHCWSALLFGWLLFPACGLLMPTEQAWKNVFYLTLLLPWLLLLPHNIKKPHIWSNPIILATAALTLYLACTTLWSSAEWKYLSFYLKQVLYILAFISSGLLLSEKHPQLLKWTIYSLMLAGSISLLLSIYAYVSIHYPYGFSELGWWYRFEGIGLLENPLVAAQSYGALCLLFLYSAFKSQSKKAQICYSIMAAIALFVVCWTRSRGPVLFLIISLLLLIVSSDRNTRIKALLYSISALICVSLVLFLFPDLQQALLNRSASISQRIEIWNAILPQTMESPIFGQGATKHLNIVTSLKTYHHTHSVWIELLLYGGYVAVALFVSHIVICLHNILRCKQGELWLIWLIFGCLCLTTNGHYLLSRPGWQWMIYWIPVAYLTVYSYNARSRTNNMATPRRHE